MDTLCKELCHEQDRNGPCPHGAHIHPSWAKMQSAADPPPAPFALRAKSTLRGHNFNHLMLAVRNSTRQSVEFQGSG